ncbi:ornithine cyclodeaminase family protein [Pseudonocardia humida]|uniref:Ornithine cyclodeaminase family protein n=1 Tax=Pseudonocardia humida TaxID=2800819 RepID=A0ABT0ZYD1_9PSEU|nr:ornithine cyclodeaminase family protein [Pseudonocardia humida]MCO1655764.1 ornithine cyclodeaminase family protein [Pseudonocardia humida]
MPQILVLSSDDVAELLDLDALLPALAEAFRRFSAGGTSAPPRTGAFAGAGVLAAMPAHLPGAGLTVKLVSVFPDNHDHGLPSHQALIAVFDDATGTPLALMDGTRITTARTGAAAAVAADALARPDAGVLAILGAGVQGGSHLDAFDRIRDFAEIRIASRTAAHASALAAQHPRARAVGSFEEAVRGADVVCCCTDAREPVLRTSWLSPGAHVGSVGGSFGPELPPDLLADRRVFVEWRGAATNPSPAGAHELQGLDPAAVTEIGEVLAGTARGRTSDEEITVYKSTGHAVEDAAAARLVLDRARATGRGTTVSL